MAGVEADTKTKSECSTEHGSVESASSHSPPQTLKRGSAGLQRSHSQSTVDSHTDGEESSFNPVAASEAGKRATTTINAVSASLVANGVRRQRAVREKEIETADPNKRIRMEIEFAIDESLARHRSRGLSRRCAFSLVAAEGQKMIRNVKIAERRDDEVIDHNNRMAKRERMLSLAGVACLALPILLLFDALSVFLPPGYREILSNGAQEESHFGKLALLTISIVDFASLAKEYNDNTGGAYCATCLVTLCTLLGMVRRFARRKRSMTKQQRDRVRTVAKAVSEHLGRRRSQLGIDHDSDDSGIDSA